MLLSCLCPVKQHDSVLAWTQGKAPTRQGPSITNLLWVTSVGMMDVLLLYCGAQTFPHEKIRRVGHSWQDVLTLSARKILPSKAQGHNHNRHFGGARVTLMLPVIILTDSPLGGEGLQESRQVRSHLSHVTTSGRCWEWQGDQEAELWCGCKPTGEKEVSGHRKQCKSAQSYCA